MQVSNQLVKRCRQLQSAVIFNQYLSGINGGLPEPPQPQAFGIVLLPLERPVWSGRQTPKPCRPTRRHPDDRIKVAPPPLSRKPRRGPLAQKYLGRSGVGRVPAGVSQSLTSTINQICDSTPLVPIWIVLVSLLVKHRNSRFRAPFAIDTRCLNCSLVFTGGASPLQAT